MKIAYALGVTLESAANTQVVIEVLQRRNADLGQFSLMNYIYSVITEGVTANLPWQSFEEN